MLKTIRILLLAAAYWGLFGASHTAVAQILSLPGWQAQLSDNSTVGITGTVTIVDEFTLQFDDFSYDGRGGGETDIVIVPFGNGVLRDRPLGVGERFNALQEFFFFDTPGSITLLDDLRAIDPSPGLPPMGADSPPIVNADFTLTVDRELFEPGTAGDAAFDEFVANNGLLGFSTISVYCHPFDFDFGSGVFLPPAPDADFDDDGLVDGGDFLELQRGFGTSGIQVPGDANRDSVVDRTDLAIFNAQYGTAQDVPGPLPGTFDEVFPNFFDRRPAASFLSVVEIPEPTTGVMALVASLGLLARRTTTRKMVKRPC